LSLGEVKGLAGDLSDKMRLGMWTNWHTFSKHLPESWSSLGTGRGPVASSRSGRGWSAGSAGDATGSDLTGVGGSALVLGGEC